MDIDYDARLPPHRQIAGWLQERIENGEFPPGKRLPSEADIMGETGVARTTARRAMAWLRKQGIVETEPGRGSYAAERGL